MTNDFTVLFTCKNCRSEDFKSPRGVKVYTDYVGAVCVGCGAKLTEADLRQHVLDLGTKRFDEFLRRAGLK